MHGISKKNQPRARRAIKLLGLTVVGLLGIAALSAQRITPAQRSQRVARNEAMGMRNVISGRVTFADGSPAVGFPVGAGFRMHKTGAWGEGESVTGADGRYEIRGLGTDEFMVGVGNGGRPYVVPTPKPVDLRKKTRASGIDFVLRLGPEIFVQVRDAETGAPVPGLRLDDGWSPLGAGKSLLTDANGEIRTRFGSTRFSLTLTDPDEKRGYGPAAGYSFVKPFDLKTIRPVAWKTLAYRRYMDDVPAVFRGVVVDEADRPVRGAQVQLLRGGPPQITTTGPSGEFRFDTRRIRDFENREGGAVLFADKGNLAASLMPKASDTWRPIRLKLSSRVFGKIVGRVVDERGRPLPACQVNALGFWGSSYAQPSVQGGQNLITDNDGRFAFQGMFPGCGYHLTMGTSFSGGKLGQTLVPANAYQGHYLRVKPAGTTDVGTIMVPHANRAISALVVNPAGRPVTKDVIVILKGAHTYLPGYPDGQGRVKFEGVVDEPLTVRVFSGTNGGFRTSDDSPDRLLTRAVKRTETSVKLVVKPRRVAP